MTATDVIHIILAIIGSSGLFAFIQYLITRKDQRSDTLKQIVEAIGAMKEASQEQAEATRTAINAVSEETSNAINALRDDMNVNDKKLRDALEENKAITARVRILRAADEIMHKMKHSKEWFDQLNDDVDFYETYCNKHPDFRNNKATHAIATINEVYAKALKENDFL